MFINGIEFGGAKGIDCTKEIVVHEKRHNYYSALIQAGATDVDPPQNSQTHYGDFLPDSAESNYGCSTSLKDTHNVSCVKGCDYLGYGDGEYAVMVDSKGTTGNASSDWSKGGKQW